MHQVVPVTLFNTLSRKIAPLEPVQPGRIGLYCCGPTVYNYAHIGNLKTYICEDILVRALRYAGYQVQHVMNITDVGHLTSDADDGEDKMILAMRREGKGSREIANYYTEAFFNDCRQLNIQRPDVVCQATEHIKEMIELVQRLEQSGYAYVADGNVYFDVTKFAGYGRLAKLDLKKLKAGARIAVDHSKRSPYDFVLWFTNSKFENQELQWESPWGVGYPGWHLECSAMSLRYLGEQFDIHCGGIDHISVHHTNEIAQTEAATGKSPWVKIWLHSEHLLFDNDKMSKSKGSVKLLADLMAAGFDPLTLRFFVLSGHYRRQLNFTWEALTTAQNGLHSLRQQVQLLRERGATPTALTTESLSWRSEFIRHLCADLNSPQALAVLWQMLNSSLPPAQQLALVYDFDQVLGLGLEAWQEPCEEVPADISAWAKQRESARQAKDWQGADELRRRIKAAGWQVKDSATGYKLLKG